LLTLCFMLFCVFWLLQWYHHKFIYFLFAYYLIIMYSWFFSYSLSSLWICRQCHVIRGLCDELSCSIWFTLVLRCSLYAVEVLWSLLHVLSRSCNTQLLRIPYCITLALYLFIQFIYFDCTHCIYVFACPPLLYQITHLIYFFFASPFALLFLAVFHFSFVFE